MICPVFGITYVGNKNRARLHLEHNLPSVINVYQLFLLIWSLSSLLIKGGGAGITQFSNAVRSLKYSLAL